MRAALLAACAALLLVVPAASAAQWTAGATAGTGVEVAGGGATWLSPLRGGALGLYHAMPRRRAKRVQVFPKPTTPPGAAGASYGGGVLAGSRTRVVLELAVIPRASRIGGPPGWPSEFLAGAPGRRLTTEERCDFEPRSGLGRTDVTGDVVARVRCDGVAEADDPADDQPPYSVGTDVQGVRIAGRYVATLEGRYDYANPTSSLDIVVYDRVARAEVYRIAAAALPGLPRSLSIQNDGKVAFTYRASDARTPTVAWASVDEPWPHPVPLARRAGYAIALAGDRIAFARDRRGSERSGGEVGIATLAGRQRLVARDGAGYSIDFDGRRLAYVRRAAGRYSVMLRSP